MLDWVYLVGASRRCGPRLGAESIGWGGDAGFWRNLYVGLRQQCFAAGDGFRRHADWLQGNKRLAGANLQAAFSYFGQAALLNYQVALLSEVRGPQLMAVVFENKSGQYLTLDGDRQVRANLGKAVLENKYWLCD